MSSLTEYIQANTLQQLLESFCAASDASVGIFDPSGTEELVGHCACGCTFEGQQFEAPVVVEGEILARVVLTADKANDPDRQQRFAQLMAEMLSRLAGQQKQLRTRADELVTLYRLTAEFTGQRDLQGVLDVVTRTVVDVMHAKGSTIRLLSDDRRELVIKSESSLSQEYLNKGPILLSESQIDQEVLKDRKPVVIEDSRIDPRVLYPQQAQREGIVSALCCPMIYKGEPLGVLRVYMGEHHKFDWFETSLAEAIAAEAAAAIVNARLYQEAVRSANMQRQLRMAATVQRRMIPRSAPNMPGLDFGTVYVPCFELGGDFYDFLKRGDNLLGISVCDVVGKGVRASLLMSSIRTSLRAHASNILDPSEVMAKVNGDLCADTEVNDFATLFYGLIDTETKCFSYVNAGHMAPVLVRNEKICHLSTGGGIVGIDPAMKWNYDSFFLQPDDVVFFYTDGLTDAMNFDDDTFGRKRVEDAVLAAVEMGRDAQGIVNHVLWEMRRFVGLHTQCDDLTIVAMKVK